MSHGEHFSPHGFQGGIMQSEVMFAGFGGQGILLIGKIFAHAAMEEGYEVAWIPSYGPEMRGGTANCSVVLSDEEIYSPVIDQADAAIVMNMPAYEKFAPKVRPGGVLIVNSSLAHINEHRDDITIEKCLLQILLMNLVARQLVTWFV